MQNIQEVSLGFAEFVSQLIQETFEAILSSQNYQLERYAELQGRLNLPNEAYRTAYNIDDKVGERVQQYFGFIRARLSDFRKFDEIPRKAKCLYHAFHLLYDLDAILESGEPLVRSSGEQRQHILGIREFGDRAVDGICDEESRSLQEEQDRACT